MGWRGRGEGPCLVSDYARGRNSVKARFRAAVVTSVTIKGRITEQQLDHCC